MKTHLIKNYRYKTTLVLLASTLTISQANAVSVYLEKDITEDQVKTSKITGKVKDANGNLPGVYVLVKDTNKATSTDLEGNFSIEVAKGQTLVFSMIGFKDYSIVYN
ncbi:carboxypeptidase-like regulatory domain-containing protein, partial [Myroides pelagicus]|uniref:carboxypeptidase-like regulatory domain-containing protein n=1 Tax=Myroides pelagicus TaxID=270914 RepID=UPI002DBBD0CF